MASFAKNLSLFFLLTLLFSLQIHARDIQFFSKVTRETTDTNTATTTSNTTATTTTADPEVQEQPSVTKAEEQEPAFIPQTTQTGYGLYGHETGQFPPSTTSTTKTTNEPPYTTTYKTQFEEPINNAAYGTDNFNSFNNNDNHMYRMDAFGTKEEGNTKESQNGYYFNTNTNTNNGENYRPEFQRLSDQNEGKKGMSDTRFLENGRYFYDVNAEKNVPYFEYQNTGRNEYFNNNNIGGYYGNNENFKSNQYKNGFQGFGSQEEEEFEFQP